MFPLDQLVKNLPGMHDTPVQFQGQEDPLERGQATHSSIHGAFSHSFPSGSDDKESTCNAGDLGWEDLEEGMASHSSILAWGIPTYRGAWWAPWYPRELDMTEQLSPHCTFTSRALQVGYAQRAVKGSIFSHLIS